MSSDALQTRTVRTRRRSPARDPLKKTSVQMHTSTLEAVKQAVERGAAASQNEFVEAAVIARLRELRREKVYASYREAAADPAYVEDMNAVAAAFEATVADGLIEKDR
jgi:Arc/MetJ-type ribon-helix-helix transcriptional regulator